MEHFVLITYFKDMSADPNKISEALTKYKWTTEKDEYLKDHYHNETIKQISAHVCFPPLVVWRRASLFALSKGIKHSEKTKNKLRIKKQFRPEINDFIKNNQTLTTKELAEALGVSVMTIRKRLKEFNVKPIVKMSEEQKHKISETLKRNLNEKQVIYIKNNINVKSRKQISKDLGISLYLVQRVINENNLIVNDEFTKKIQADRSKEHVCLATAASNLRYEDPIFRERMSKISTDRNRTLWNNEEYRLKVRNGIRRNYENSNLRGRLSTINKERYKNNQSVKDILHAPRPFKTSKLNDLVALKLDAFGIKYEPESLVGWHLWDFKIGNVLLEINSWWHTRPEAIANDRSKRTMIAEHYPQYTVKTIWENEIKSVRGNELLLETIGQKSIIPIEVNLKDVVVVENPPDVERFLMTFHYLGSTLRQKHCFGVLLHGESIAVAVFGQPVRQKTAPGKVLELVRLCRHPKFYNKNLMSFFLSRCVKKIKTLNVYDNLVSFADLRHHTGGVYRACNWVCINDTSPDYEYASQTMRPMHKKTLYNRAVAEGLTEAEYAEKHGFIKTSIGQKRKFILKLR